MKIHGHLNDDDFAQLVEGATSRLTLQEQQALHSHLEECAACRDAYGWVQPLAADLQAVASPLELEDSGSELWNRIEAVLPDQQPSIQPWREWEASQDESQLVRQSSSEDWTPTAIEGVEARRLSVDNESSSLTMLIRMAPGASYPAHEHAGPEECYVLEGDLVIDDLTMHAGDFQRMEAGTRHPDQHTVGGCLLMLRSSLNDRLAS